MKFVGGSSLDNQKKHAGGDIWSVINVMDITNSRQANHQKTSKKNVNAEVNLNIKIEYESNLE